MKFLGLFKANAEIDRLTSELAKANEQICKLEQASKTPVIDTAALDELTKANTELDAQVATLRSDLATAKQTISTLSLERDAALGAAKDFDSKVQAKAEQLASVKAAEITAKLGQPPVPDNPGSQKPEGSSNLTGLARAIAAHKAASLQH